MLIISITNKAQLPLVTDNAETCGIKVLQLENAFIHSIQHYSNIVEWKYENSLTLSYGTLNNIELKANFPFRYFVMHNDTFEQICTSFSDLTLETKILLNQNKYLLTALKPGIVIPSYGHNNELSIIETYPSLFYIVEYLKEKIALNAMLGLSSNFNYGTDKRRIVHFSAFADYSLKKISILL